MRRCLNIYLVLTENVNLLLYFPPYIGLAPRPGSAYCVSTAIIIKDYKVGRLLCSYRVVFSHFDSKVTKIIVALSQDMHQLLNFLMLKPEIFLKVNVDTYCEH